MLKLYQHNDIKMYRKKSPMGHIAHMWINTFAQNMLFAKFVLNWSSGLEDFSKKKIRQYIVKTFPLEKGVVLY